MTPDSPQHESPANRPLTSRSGLSFGWSSGEPRGPASPAYENREWPSVGEGRTGKVLSQRLCPLPSGPQRTRTTVLQPACTTS